MAVSKETKQGKSAKIHCLYDKLIDPKSLKNHPKNRNKHGQDQIDRLSELYKYHGVRHPIIVSKKSGFIVAGHGRKLSAIRAGIKAFPVVFQDFETDEQEYAFIQSDNAIALWADLDLSGINSDLGDLGPDFDINMLGIKDFALDMADKEGLTDPDEVPENVEPICKIGQIWRLGEHRLMCGDSTDINQVEKLMDKKNADITFSSPPYNLGDNAKLRGYNGDGEDTVYNEKSDHKSQEDYLKFMSAWTNVALKFSTTVFCNVQLLAGNKLALPKYWMEFHDKLIDIMIWDKEHAQPSAAPRVLNSVFELIFIFTDENNPKRSIKTGKEFRGTLQNIFRLNPVRGGKDEFQKSHGAVFPVAFAEHFITKFSTKSVLELFGGSGSTLIACEKTNRKCFMMELDPHYCDVIIARWEKFTGNKAELIHG